MHGGTQFHVEHLDFKERKAYVKKVDVDYYTDAIRYTQVRILETAATSNGCDAASLHSDPAISAVTKNCHPEQSEGSAFPRLARHRSSDSRALFRNPHSHGDVLVRSQVIGFKKIKLFTNENIGAGQLQLPENEMHTTAYWITLERPLLDSLPFSVNERQSGMFGLLHALESVGTLLLMCDGRDLGTAIGERPPAPQLGKVESPSAANDFTPTRVQDVTGSNAKEFFEPNLYLFDAYPSGIGFSEPLFRAHDLLVRRNARINRRVCLRARLSILRRTRRRFGAPRAKRPHWRFSIGCVPDGGIR